MSQETAKSLANIDFGFDHRKRNERPFQGNVYLAASLDVEPRENEIKQYEAIKLDNLRRLVRAEISSVCPESLNLGTNPEFQLKVKEVIENTKPLGGGVFGKVWELGEVVAKTANPSAFRSFWRRVNWGFAPFPSRYSETAAQHDTISAQIIHEVTKVAFSGLVNTPRPTGYVFVENVGFVQILEKVSGRGPRFDINEIDEFEKIREVLKDFGYASGFEQVAQIHPENPGGLENISWNGNWMQKDLHAALKHTGWVWPAFYFPFHKEIRREFEQNEPTYNKIHTERLRAFLDKLSLDQETRHRLDLIIRQYDSLRLRYEVEQRESLKEKNIKSWQVLGKIDAKKAETMRGSQLRYLAYYAEQPLSAILKVGEKSHDYLHRKFELALLAGPRTAYQKGYINQSEWETVQRQFEKSDPHITPYFLFWASSFLFGRAKNIPEGYLYIHSVKNLSLWPPVLDVEPWTFAQAVLVGWVSPPLVRCLVGLSLGKIFKKDMRTAVLVGLIPKSGEIATAAQIRHDLKTGGYLYWHYTKRKLAAGISKVLFPHMGGWGTDAETWVWNTGVWTDRKVIVPTRRVAKYIGVKARRVASKTWDAVQRL